MGKQLLEKVSVTKNTDNDDDDALDHVLGCLFGSKEEIYYDTIVSKSDK